MIKVWRICRRRHATTAFSGEGARRSAGRWAHAGVPVVYTAESASLAVVEMLVRMDPEDAPNHYVLIGATIPDEVPRSILTVPDLPENWRAYPPPESTRALGDQWLADGKTAVLMVPSTVVPQEGNYLLNPVHPDMARIAIDQPDPFAFDPRLWSALAGKH